MNKTNKQSNKKDQTNLSRPIWGGEGEPIVSASVQWICLKDGRHMIDIYIMSYIIHHMLVIRGGDYFQRQCRVQWIC